MLETQPSSALPDHGDQRLVEELAQIRREFHRHPELSWLELATTARIAGRLEKLGFNVTTGASLYAHEPQNWAPLEQRQTAWQQAAEQLGSDNRWLNACREGHTGLVATLDSGNPGPCVGFRFDIDALPIQESNTDQHRPVRDAFASLQSGVMHACGHDGHITVGIGLAERLVGALQHDSSAWSGKVHLFFQPAEEIAGGGAVFAELPQLQEVERFATFHIGITGQREIVLDATWLAATIVDVDIDGRSSHAGNAPEQGHNALLAACIAIQGLYALPRNSAGVTRINVGQLHCDNAQNVIADHARFRMEVRGGNNDCCQDMISHAEKVIQGAALMQTCVARLTPVSRFEAYPNHQGFVDQLQHDLEDIGVPGKCLRRAYQVPASEDATNMSRVVQENGGLASHLLIGCDTRGGHHNPRFDFDEDLMAWGVDVFYRIVSST